MVSTQQVAGAARRAIDGEIVVTDDFGRWTGTIVRLTDTAVLIRQPWGGHRGMRLSTITAVAPVAVYRGRLPRARAW